MDSVTNKAFHALMNELPLDANDKGVLRMAIIWQVSNNEKNSWTLLNDQEGIEAIRLVKIQIKRLKK